MERDQEEAVHRALEDYYRAGKPPWDTGVAPPELVALVEGPDALSPGRALDLGCGTGTNAVYLARHGWDVVGVDLIDHAARQAREKAAAAGVGVRVLRGDATRLDDLDVPGSYAAGLSHRAAPGARLMFGYGPGAFEDTFSGVTAEELRARFTGRDLVDTTPGTNSVPTFWFTLRRNAMAA